MGPAAPRVRAPAGATAGCPGSEGCEGVGPVASGLQIFGDDSHEGSLRGSGEKGGQLNFRRPPESGGQMTESPWSSTNQVTGHSVMNIQKGWGGARIPKKCLAGHSDGPNKRPPIGLFFCS